MGVCRQVNREHVDRKRRVYLFTCLRLYWIACVNPCGKAAQDRSSTRKAIVQHKERRTGARMLVLSGTVGDDPLAFIKRQISNIILELI